MITWVSFTTIWQKWHDSNNRHIGRYRALLADNRQSLQGDVHDHEPIPDPNDSEEAFLEYLAYVFDYPLPCNMTLTHPNP